MLALEVVVVLEVAIVVKWRLKHSTRRHGISRWTRQSGSYLRSRRRRRPGKSRIERESEGSTRGGRRKEGRTWAKQTSCKKSWEESCSYHGWGKWAWSCIFGRWGVHGTLRRRCEMTTRKWCISVVDFWVSHTSWFDLQYNEFSSISIQFPLVSIRSLQSTNYLAGVAFKVLYFHPITLISLRDIWQLIFPLQNRYHCGEVDDRDVVFREVEQCRSADLAEVVFFGVEENRRCAGSFMSFKSLRTSIVFTSTVNY